ncbi:ABC transporter substrate-binding protein [candidate division KSB1 bacterium]
MKLNKKILFRFLSTILMVFLLSILNCSDNETELETVKYGITPYQDSALPVVANYLDWYKTRGIKFELVPLAWGDVITAISSGAIDVAIYNFNSFQAPYENAAKGNRKPIYYCPTYIFKGQALMVHDGIGYEVFRDVAGEDQKNRTSRLATIINQLKKKRIAITKGTELEQIVLEGLKIAGLNSERDVQLIHSAPEDALAAFLSKDVDAFAAGLTERTEARRHGAIELFVTSDVTLPVIDGIITSNKFAENNLEILDKLVDIWFKTIKYMEEDLENNSKYILDYLSKAASTRYSVEEYQVAWSFNIFPKTPQEAISYFIDEKSPYFWRKAWDANNVYLLEEKKINNAIPYSAFWGEDVLKRLTK